MQCLELPVPAAAEIIYDKSVDPNYPFGTEALYQCAEGFRLEAGNKARVCEMDGLRTTGTWSGVEPVCERKHIINNYALLTLQLAQLVMVFSIIYMRVCSYRDHAKVPGY